MSKIAVYTAIFDNYDVLLDPEYAPEEIDFFCFTDQSIDSDIWKEVRPDLDDNLSPKLKNCKIMMKAHEYLPEYQYSLYIDGNIYVKKDISELLEKYLDSDFAVPRHPDRNCIYDEAEAIIENGKANPEKVRNQMKRYRNEGFPEEYGLPETRVIFRRHNKEEVISVMEDWWKEMQQGAERDQLSFSYVAWKNYFDFTYMDENPNSDNCEIFDVIPHRPSGFEEIYFDYWIPIYARRNKNRFYRAIYPPINALKILTSEGPKSLATSVKKRFSHKQNETKKLLKL